ncbi:cupin domain-containing protein [Roseivivax isoporae]|uniref:Cupin type-1 domain-containing protein n=1 Tax=Roseivivax isoporae LMG 25204 TaxID=1449351 RepID=X7FFE9_9RHOB|nr:cupin domain-containing protein [Roseivivax isoporae]ETX30759.1 hypothetical protein RISW2_08105 [Roseivivax isoporae LMG 25204]
MAKKTVSRIRGGVRPARASAEAAVETLWLSDDGGIPNNPDLPVVLIHGALDAEAGDAAIRALFEAQGWRGTWTWTVFDFHHYHPDAHEALAVARGWGDIQLGGPSGPVLHLRAGDAMVLPAGTGHCRIAQSEDFAVCGGYPPDHTDVGLARADDPDQDRHRAQIARVSRPETDPLFGAAGPLVRLWDDVGA